MIGIERVLQAVIYLASLVGVAPLFPALDLFTRIVFVLALVGGMLCDRRRRYRLTALPASLLTLLFFVGYLAQISRLNLAVPVANLLVLLLAVRLLSEKQGRHVLQIFVLAIFALAASTLVSLSPLFLVYLVALVLLIACGLILLSFYGAEPGLLLNRRQWRLLWSTGLLLPVGSLLLMLVFFLILPRTQHPLWNFLNAPARASIGFSDQVRPGSVAELSGGGRTALRVEMEPVPPADLYWRGIVLNRIDGQIWRRDGAPPGERSVAASGAPLVQTIYIDAKDDRFLPALDLPFRMLGLANEPSADAVYKAGRALKKLSSYQVRSTLDAVRVLTSDRDRPYYLQVPEAVSPMVAAVAAEIRRNGRTSAEKISALERFFLSRNLSYSSSGLTTTATPVETFLFESKQGYCEYFATSFALLLRLSGVPARLVGGYLGGEYNQLGGYYLVSEDRAHVWVEALDDDGRWQRIDPSLYAVNAGAALGQQQRGRFSPRLLLDTLDYYWTRMVISYDLSAQFQLLRQAGRRFESIRSPGGKRIGAGLAAVCGCCLAGWLLLRMKNRPGRQERLLGRYLRQVEKRFATGPLDMHTGLFELARQTGAPLCHEFAARYGRIVYRDRRLTREDFRRLNAIIRLLDKS
jgi:transglutaminase-like putative cysteine protease